MRLQCCLLPVDACTRLCNVYSTSILIIVSPCFRLSVLPVLCSHTLLGPQFDLPVLCNLALPFVCLHRGRPLTMRRRSQSMSGVWPEVECRRMGNDLTKPSLTCVSVIGAATLTCCWLTLLSQNAMELGSQWKRTW